MYTCMQQMIGHILGNKATDVSQSKLPTFMEFAF